MKTQYYIVIGETCKEVDGVWTRACSLFGIYEDLAEIEGHVEATQAESGIERYGLYVVGLRELPRYLGIYQPNNTLHAMLNWGVNAQYAHAQSLYMAIARIENGELKAGKPPAVAAEQVPPAVESYSCAERCGTAVSRAGEVCDECKRYNYSSHKLITR